MLPMEGGMVPTNCPGGVGGGGGRRGEAARQWGRQEGGRGRGMVKCSPCSWDLMTRPTTWAPCRHTQGK